MISVGKKCQIYSYYHIRIIIGYFFEKSYKKRIAKISLEIQSCYIMMVTFPPYCLTNLMESEPYGANYPPLCGYQPPFDPIDPKPYDANYTSLWGISTIIWPN